MGYEVMGEVLYEAGISSLVNATSDGRQTACIKQNGQT
jgi:hypothetical protein